MAFAFCPDEKWAMSDGIKGIWMIAIDEQFHYLSGSSSYVYLFAAHNPKSFLIRRLAIFNLATFLSLVVAANTVQE